MKKHFANFITLINLLWGIIAIWLVLQQHIEWACYAVILGAVFDFLDGWIARTLNITSALGKELDSLSDVVTFGVTPMVIIISILPVDLATSSTIKSFLIVFPFFFNTLCAALRLAKFNLDKRQTYYFIGLPVPANAMFFVSIAHLTLHHSSVASLLASHYYIYYLLSVSMALLMISPIPMMALKFKHFHWNNNEVRYLTLFLGLLIIVTLGIDGLSLCVLLYIIVSLVAKKYIL